MPRPERIHWGITSVGITVFIAGLASPGLSLGWRITICGVGCLFVLLAIGLPRRLAREAVRAFDAHSRKARREHDTATASQLLRNAADELSSLPTRDIGEVPGLGVFALVKKSFTLRKAMATYRRKHQAATVYAVETGLSAGAKDSGALQLAQSAANNTDLLALEVELFRMALELSPSI